MQAFGPKCCGCLCPAAGKIQIALASEVLPHDEATARCLGAAEVPEFGGCRPFLQLLPNCLPPDIKKVADAQIAFFRQLCRLKMSVTQV